MLFVLLHLLTAVLVVLKLCGVFAAGWLAVLSPSIVALVLGLIAFVFVAIAAIAALVASTRRFR